MSVYWYWLLEERAPTLITGGFWRYVRIPGTRASLGWSSLITSSAESLRCERGFRRMMTRPAFEFVLPPPPPATDMKEAMLGSFPTTAATAFW